MASGTLFSCAHLNRLTVRGRPRVNWTHSPEDELGPARDVPMARAPEMPPENPRCFSAPQAHSRREAGLLLAARTSVGAASPGPLLTLHVLQLNDFHLGVPPLAPDVKRHVGVLEQPSVSLGVALEARAETPSEVLSRPGRGVHGNSHGSGSRHSGDGLAVAGHGAAQGSGRWVPRFVRTGPPGA